MDKVVFTLAILFSSIFCFANSQSQEKVIEFFSKADMAKPIGKIKFEETKEQILAVFESTNLKKGKYKIVKLDDCVAGSKIKAKSNVEILNFETQHGEISTEKRLSESKITDLQLEIIKLGLLKSEKNYFTVIACEIETKE